MEMKIGYQPRMAPTTIEEQSVRAIAVETKSGDNRFITHSL
jgi:hypothetical protein